MPTLARITSYSMPHLSITGCNLPDISIFQNSFDEKSNKHVCGSAYCGS